MILVCHMNLQDQYGWKPLMANYQLSTFLDHRYCSSRDIIILVCQAISQDHVIEASCNFMGSRPSR